MSFHLEGPWLSTIGKKKGKQKFRNAAAAKRARENASSWEELKKQHGITSESRKKSRAMSAPVYTPPKPNYRGSDLPRIPSLPFTGDACLRGQDKIYTGDAILGIGTMHKSNAVPIFSDDQAKEISKMRR